MEIYTLSDQNHQLSEVMLDELGEYSPFIEQLKMIKSSSYPDICCVSCRFDTHYFNKRLYQHFGCFHPLSLNRAVRKRKAEYLAGRVVAMHALEYLGTLESQVFIGRNRAPIWPHEFLGSITHTDKRALALVGRKSHYRYVGIDCENLFSLETAHEVEPIITNFSEKIYLSMLDAPFSCILTLAFSAKETLFKALYPHVLDYFDFDAVEISDICLYSKCFYLTLCKDLSSTLIKGMKFKGGFLLERNTVITFICN